jgi:hypothetical protein
VRRKTRTRKRKFHGPADRCALLMSHRAAGSQKTKRFSVSALQSKECGLGFLKIARLESA